MPCEGAPTQDAKENRGVVSSGNARTGVRAQKPFERHDSRDFWFDLLAQFDFYDAKILEHIYDSQCGATTLLTLVRHLRRIGIKREALRRRVRMLARLGLVDIAERTKPLCIQSRVALEAKVLALVRGVHQRLGVVKR